MLLERIVFSPDKGMTSGQTTSSADMADLIDRAMEGNPVALDELADPSQTPPDGFVDNMPAALGIPAPGGQDVIPA